MTYSNEWHVYLSRTRVCISSMNVYQLEPRTYFSPIYNYKNVKTLTFHLHYCLQENNKNTTIYLLCVVWKNCLIYLNQSHELSATSKVSTWERGLENTNTVQYYLTGRPRYWNAICYLFLRIQLHDQIMLLYHFTRWVEVNTHPKHWLYRNIKCMFAFVFSFLYIYKNPHLKMSLFYT